MILYSDALKVVLTNSRKLPQQVVELQKSLGYRLAEPRIAPFSQPRFHNSAVDGYGFRTSDFLEVSEAHPCIIDPIESVRAGEESIRELPTKGVVKVLTGAPIPTGVDAVIMREELEVNDGLLLKRRPIVGEHIRYAGNEVGAGAELLPAFTKVTPAVVGLLATFGFTKVKVFRKPKVSLFSSGDELVDIGAPLCKPTQIFDSNLPALVAGLAAQGITPRLSERLPDDLTATMDALHHAMRHSDIVITCGGVSMGEYDFIRTAALKLGVVEKFWKVAIKPGKPIFFGVYGSKQHSKLFFGLPGNPVSVLVTFEQFVLPAIRKMMGSASPVGTIQQGFLTKSIRKNTGRLDFVRAVAHWDHNHYKVTPMQAQESHMLSGIAQANAILHFPEESEVLSECSPVLFQWLTQNGGVN